MRGGIQGVGDNKSQAAGNKSQAAGNKWQAAGNQSQAAGQGRATVTTRHTSRVTLVTGGTGNAGPPAVRRGRPRRG